MAETDLLSPKVREALATWTSNIEAARHYTGDLASVIEMVVEKAGIIDALEQQLGPDAQGRLENIREFLLIAKEFDESHEDIISNLESMAELRRAGVEGVPKEGAPSPAASAPAPAPSAAASAPAPAPSAAALAPAPALSDAALAPAPSAAPGTPLDDSFPNVATTSTPQDDYADLKVAAQKLPAFLEWLALRSDLDNLSGQTTAVTLMTIHSAKGLEFPVVFVAGLEEGLFPNLLFDNDPAKLEEERRLAYVAITRARQKLFLTYASSRRTYGSTTANPRSRFVGEIPDADITLTGVGSAGFSGWGWEKRGDRRGMYGTGGGLYGSDGGVVFGGGSHQESAASRSEVSSTSAQETFEKGDLVHHKIFGNGVVMEVKGDELTVHFEKTNKTKRLLRTFAPLVKIEK